MKITVLTAATLLLLSTLSASAALTAAEIADIETAFGITLSSNQVDELDAVVNPTHSPTWRTDAQTRIEQNRRADLDIQVVDQNGDPVEGAQVSVELKRNAFHFGGTFSAKDFSGVGSGSMTMSTNTYQDRLLSLFNSVGLNNGFKPRLTGIHPYLPGVKNWAIANELPLRGHLLIWPGVDDDSNHLTADVLGDVKAVEAALTNGSPQNVIDDLRDDLRTTVSNEMVSWASQHDVYEWDVINEPLSNHRVQDALDDYDVMAEWFEIAENNKVSANTGLRINEFQIISAMSESRKPGWYTDRRDRYMTEIDRLITNNAPITGIGFQSRIKHERRDPQIIYDRLEEWGGTYGREMVGTEFEVVSSDPGDWMEYIYTDEERAQITEEMMTQYYSHPLITGLNAWNTIHDGEEALVDYDGNPTRHGLVWYYMHRHRYSTETELASSLGGATGLRAYEGDYDITISYKNEEVAFNISLSSNQTAVITLPSTVADAAIASTVVDAWHYDGLADGSGLSSAASTGLIGGVTFPDYAIGSIQHEAVRWQSDGITDSMYRLRDLSFYDNASNGIFQLSVDYLDADFTATSALSNGLGRVQFAIRDASSTDAGFRLIFTSGGGSDPKFRLEAADDLNSNHNIGTFAGTTLGHLSVRAIFDLNNRGSAGSLKVYYRFNGGAEVEAHVGQLPSDFDLGQLRYVVQTDNGGADWAAGDRISVDNLVIRKLDDIDPPVFTIDPISKPDAAQDTSYTGQTIAGTASNAVAYSKLMGPAWLNIAADGTLSGTPSGSDAGANSWIVQASNGAETDTAVLNITVAGTGSGIGGDISIVHQSDLGFYVPSSNFGTNSYSISAQSNDVVVLTVASNKRGSVVPLSCDKVGGTGTTGPQTELTNQLTTYPTSWAWYQTVTTPGTFDFEITTDNTQGITAISAMYVVRAGSGTVQLGDSATWNDTDNADNGTSYPLDYTFSESLPGGVLIETISSRTDVITRPAAYTQDRYADKRLLASYEGVTGSSWSSTYTLSGGEADKQTSGAAGMIFVEITSGGDPRPVFDSDPVVELYAVEDEAYTGSTLTDNASGVASPSFAKVSGPAWLSVASNGALTGTPTSSDLGTNSWKVLATDGTATNFATLEINVIVPGSQMNVLFIAIDDMNPIIGAYGNSLIETPNMDQLAARGTTFLNAHCQWSVCGPSRASIMTGLMPEQTGVMGFTKMRGISDNGERDNSRGVTNIVTLSQHLIDFGYTTAASGKINDYRCVGSMNPDGTINEDGGTVDDPPSWSYLFQNSSGVGGTTIPWAHDPGSNGELAAESVDQPAGNFTDGVAATQGIDMMNHLATNQPFFLGVGFKKPHLPFLAPKSSWDLYERDDFTPHPFPYEMANATGYALNSVTELRNTYYLEENGSGQALQLTSGILPDDQQKLLLHGYYACISHVDEQVGRVLDELDTLGLTSNTVVVLWGDHGFHLGDHNEWGKHTNLEQATRVPFIISVPGLPEGQGSGTPVGLLDIFPTLCELLNVPEPIQPPNSVDPSPRPLAGRSLAPLLEGTVEQVQTGIVNHYGGNNYGYAYRTDRYRYIEWINSSGTVLARELYDYQEDPMETINLAGEPGFEGLIYQFSISMRDAAEAGGCDRLKGSTPPAAPSNTMLGGLELANGQISWPEAAGVTYTLMSNSNLVSGTWVTNQTGVTAPVVIPIADPKSFFRIDVSE